MFLSPDQIDRTICYMKLAISQPGNSMNEFALYDFVLAAEKLAFYEGNKKDVSVHMLIFLLPQRGDI